MSSGTSGWHLFLIHFNGISITLHKQPLVNLHRPPKGVVLLQ